MGFAQIHFLVNLSNKSFSRFFHHETINHEKPSPRTGPEDLLVTNYDCDDHQQKTLHKYAINQVIQCESEPQDIESKTVIATIYSKARATTLIGYKLTGKISETKVHF